jgi:hypothetical protein
MAVQERGVLYRAAVDLTHTRKICNYEAKCRHLFKLMDDPSIGRYSGNRVRSQSTYDGRYGFNTITASGEYSYEGAPFEDNSKMDFVFHHIANPTTA